MKYCRKFSEPLALTQKTRFTASTPPLVLVTCFCLSSIRLGGVTHLVSNKTASVVIEVGFDENGRRQRRRRMNEAEGLGAGALWSIL